jgi:hypothetical protein
VDKLLAIVHCLNASFGYFSSKSWIFFYFPLTSFLKHGKILIWVNQL